MRDDFNTWTGLEPKVKTLWMCESAISGLFMAGLGFVADLIIRSARDGAWTIGYIGVPALILFVGGGILLVSSRFNNAKYHLGGEDLAYGHGIFWKSRRYIARARVQHVDITAGPIARALNLVHLSVFVGGQAAAAISIPGLSPEEGERLRSTLLESARFQKHTQPAPVEPELPPAQSPVEPPPQYPTDLQS